MYLTPQLLYMYFNVNKTTIVLGNTLSKFKKFSIQGSKALSLSSSVTGTYSCHYSSRPMTVNSS